MKICFLIVQQKKTTNLNLVDMKKFKIRKSSYKYFPKSKEELKDLLEQLIKERRFKNE